MSQIEECGVEVNERVVELLYLCKELRGGEIHLMQDDVHIRTGGLTCQTALDKAINLANRLNGLPYDDARWVDEVFSGNEFNRVVLEEVEYLEYPLAYSGKGAFNETGRTVIFDSAE